MCHIWFDHARIRNKKDTGYITLSKGKSSSNDKLLLALYVDWKWFLLVQLTRLGHATINTGNYLQIFDLFILFNDISYFIVIIVNQCQDSFTIILVCSVFAPLMFFLRALNFFLIFVIIICLPFHLVQKRILLIYMPWPEHWSFTF